MKKRIFVGIKISNILAEKIGKFRKTQLFPVRWIEGKNLHITLIPPWYEEHPSKLTKILSGIQEEIGSFALHFIKVTYGPDPRRPRLIWVEGEVPDELLSLKKAVEKALNKRSEKRMYKLHLTIARFNPHDFKKFKIREIYEKVDWRMNVTSFQLFESKLHSKGAQYSVLDDFRLQRHAANSGEKES